MNWIAAFFGTHSYGGSPEDETAAVRLWFIIGLAGGVLVTLTLLGH